MLNLVDKKNQEKCFHGQVQRSLSEFSSRPGFRRDMIYWLVTGTWLDYDFPYINLGKLFWAKDLTKVYFDEAVYHIAMFFIAFLDVQRENCETSWIELKELNRPKCYFEIKWSCTRNDSGVFLWLISIAVAHTAPLCRRGSLWFPSYPLAVYTCRSHGVWVCLSSRKATITPQKKNVGSRKMREMLYNALEEIEDIRTVTCWLHFSPKIDHDEWFFISFQKDGWQFWLIVIK